MDDQRPTGPPTVSARGPADRLDSWKEIASFLKRDVKTVQRWERREGMPVHRHVHEKLGSVYAFRAELEAWSVRRAAVVEADGAPNAPAGEVGRGERAPAEPEPGAAASAGEALRGRGAERPWTRLALLLLLVAICAFALAVLEAWRFRGRGPEDPLAGAQFRKLTDFGGIEQAAALSPDGQFVAFLSDRDGQMDVWVTQLGSGQFVNVTRGSVAELVNPSVRTLGFSPDGTLVTFWARGGTDRPDISVFVAPLLGGAHRPFLEGVAELDWSNDGRRLVFHTPGPGDPMFVRDGAAAEPRRIFAAPEGLHAHFLRWSPDAAYIYFVQGTLPDGLDLWRIRPEGGAPERLTHHDALVSHPVFLDDRTLLYLATDADGFGPWIHALDVEERLPRKVSPGVDGYTSLSASRDGRRLVATLARPRRTLWRVPVVGARADVSAAERIPLTTGDGASPRFGPGFLVYVCSKGTADGVWKLANGSPTELWSAPDARVVGAPAIARDGRVAFTARQEGATILWTVNADGTDARVVTRALDLRGAPAWAPDGRSLTIAAMVDGEPRLHSVPLDGGAPAPLVREQSMDPAWSPRGELVAYSGADVGTTFPIRAATGGGAPLRIPALTLSRGSRRLAFIAEGRSLVVLRGDLQKKNLWRVDLETGAEFPMTDVPRGFHVRDFDVSPDGREVVLEQVQDDSDVVLIERPGRGTR